MLNRPGRRGPGAAIGSLSRLAFGLVIVLSPFRARVELAPRPSPPLYGDYTDILLFWSDVAILLTLALWAGSLVVRRPDVRVSVGPLFLAGPVAGLLGVAWLGVPGAIDPTLAAYNALRFTVLAALGLYVINEVDGPRTLRGALAVMIIVQAVVVVAQVVGQQSVGLELLGEHGLAPSLPVSVVTAIDGSRLLRGYGLADHPNILGGLLAFALVLVVLPARRREAVRVSGRALFAVGAVALLLTFSRAAGLALLAGLAALSAMMVVRGERAVLRAIVSSVLVAGVACLPFVLAHGPHVVARAEASAAIGTELRSLSEREALTAAASDVFRDRPLLGVGLGGLPLAIRDARPDFPYAYQPAHLVLLDVAAETGAAGGLLYLAILALPWLALVRQRLRWTPDLAAASAALAATTVVGFFDYYTWSYPAGRIWSFVVLALWAAAYVRAPAAQPVASAATDHAATATAAAGQGTAVEPAGA